jgi:hypothetical protein
MSDSATYREEDSIIKMKRERWGRKRLPRSLFFFLGHPKPCNPLTPTQTIHIGQESGNRKFFFNDFFCLSVHRTLQFLMMSATNVLAPVVVGLDGMACWP